MLVLCECEKGMFWKRTTSIGFWIFNFFPWILCKFYHVYPSYCCQLNRFCGSLCHDEHLHTTKHIAPMMSLLLMPYLTLRLLSPRYLGVHLPLADCCAWYFSVWQYKEVMPSLWIKHIDETHGSPYNYFSEMLACCPMCHQDAYQCKVIPF